MPTYYINADSGNNGNTGGSGDPWLTLAYAITNSVAGDTIICQAATASYAWATQAIADRTIKATTYGDATFDASAGDVNWTLSGTIAIENLIFTNAVQADLNSPFIFTAVDGYSNAFTACTFHDITIVPVVDQRYGVFGRGASSTTETVTLANCVIYDIKETVAGNSVVFGLRDWNGTLTVTGCTFYDDKTGGSQVLGIFNAFNSGGSLTYIIKNNIFVADGGQFSVIIGAPAVLVFDNNCHFNTADSPSGSNNITSDPQFIDAASANFNFQIDSPARAAGTTP